MKAEGYIVRFNVCQQGNVRFSPETQFDLEMFRPQVVLYYHGDGITKQQGRIICIEQREDGLWCEAEVHADSDAARLIEQGRAAWSSGSASHHIQHGELVDGCYPIQRWVIHEVSIVDKDHAAAPNGATSVRAVQDLLVPCHEVAVKAVKAADAPASRVPAAAPVTPQQGVTGMKTPYDDADALELAFYLAANDAARSQDRGWPVQFDEQLVRTLCAKVTKIGNELPASSSRDPARGRLG